MSLFSLDQLSLNPHTSQSTHDLVQTRYTHEAKYSNLNFVTLSQRRYNFEKNYCL